MARTPLPLLSFLVLVSHLAQQHFARCAEEEAASLHCSLGPHCWDAATALTTAASEGGMVAAAVVPSSGYVLHGTRSVTDDSSLLHVSTEVVRAPGKIQADQPLHPPPLRWHNRSKGAVRWLNRSKPAGGLLRELEDNGLVSEKAVMKIHHWWGEVLQLLRDVDEEPSLAHGFPGKNGSYKRYGGRMDDDMVWKRVARTNPISAWYVAHRVKKMMAPLAFFQSAGFIDWACFLVAMVFFCRLHVYLLAKPATRGSHSWALLVWMVAGGVYNLIIWMRLGMDAGRSWLTGYWLELIFSMENVFIFHIVAKGFRMSEAHSRKALVFVICFQILFQMVFYMGLAELLTSIWALPYILGAWLVYVGLSTAKEDHDHQDSADAPGLQRGDSWDSQKRNRATKGESAGSNLVTVAKIWSGYVRCFRTLLGERFECGYGSGEPSFFTYNGLTRATLLVPAMLCLLAVDFTMEIDVTLTKIMEIQHAFIAFTSSVAAAFAVPELFFVAQDLLAKFRLLKYGISFVLVFFGMLLLLHQVVNVNDMVLIVFIILMMVICALLSWLIPPPIQQRDDGSRQPGTPEDFGVDGCPEVAPSSPGDAPQH